MNWPQGVAAFANHVKQLFKDNKWYITNGIFFPSTIDKERIQTIIHEYLHFLSYNEKIEPKNNLYHNKRGLAFSVYDEFDNLIDSQYSCGFLNEGLTELLASKILKRKPSAYEFNCLIVDLLIMNNHNELIEAYFSEDYEKIVNYKNLFEQQADCNFELIFNNQKYGTGISKERTEAMILACIIYQVNSVQSYEELDKIQIDINKILSKYQIFGFEYDIETIIGQTIELINEKKHNFNNKHK